MRRPPVALFVVGMLMGFPTPAWANASLWLSSSATNLSASAVNYFSVMADSGPNATEGFVQSVVPVAGTIKELRVLLNGSPGNGAGTQTYTFVVMVAGSPSALTCAISEADTSCTDVTNEVSLTAGQLIEIRSTPANTPLGRNVTTSITFYSTASGGGDASTALLGGSGGTVVSALADNFVPVHAHDVPSATEFDMETWLPVAGTFKNLYIELDGSPDNGVGTQDYIFTLRVDNVDSALTCTISETATTCNDTTNLVSVTAAQAVSLEVDPSASAPTARYVKAGVVFVPATAGQFLLANSGADTLNGAATEYGRVSSGGGSFNATETARDTLTSAFQIQTIAVEVSADPDNGAGTQSYQFDFRDDTADAGPTCTISQGSTSCTNTTNATVAVSSLIDTQVTPANTPLSTITAHISYAGFLTPRRVVMVE